MSRLTGSLILFQCRFDHEAGSEDPSSTCVPIFSSKTDIPRLNFRDLTIFNMAAVRHIGLLFSMLDHSRRCFDGPKSFSKFDGDACHLLFFLSYCSVSILRIFRGIPVLPDSSQSSVGRPQPNLGWSFESHRCSTTVF